MNAGRPGLRRSHIPAVRPTSSNASLALPADPVNLADVVAKGLSELRLAGVTGPYSLVLSADAYTLVSEKTEHGYRIREHLNRLLGDGESSGPRRSTARC